MFSIYVHIFNSIVPRYGTRQPSFILVDSDPDLHPGPADPEPERIEIKMESRIRIGIKRCRYTKLLKAEPVKIDCISREMKKHGTTQYR